MNTVMKLAYKGTVTSKEELTEKEKTVGDIWTVNDGEFSQEFICIGTDENGFTEIGKLSESQIRFSLQTYLETCSSEALIKIYSTLIVMLKKGELGDLDVVFSESKEVEDNDE